MYRRVQVSIIEKRMHEVDNPIMQVVVGPRQTGKSTMLSQACKDIDIPVHSVSADDALIPGPDWLSTEWQQARNLTRGGKQPAILIIDEIQKAASWSTVIKSLWDADRRNELPLKVFLSGSSTLLLNRGLEDSLMGRFELIRSPHWSLTESKDAFGFSLDDFLYFGGFPGSARYVEDERRWVDYMRDSVIEPTISRDVLALDEIRKPALMRALFHIGAAFSAQELSYNKMLGQLQDAGNTVTLARYLELLSKAGMVTGLPKYSAKMLSRRNSSPRLMVFATSLCSATSDKTKEQLLGIPDLRGHLVESAVGAYLLARASQEGFEVSWWREGTKEVDFVLSRGDELSAIEVKSGRTKGQSGMTNFLKLYPHAKRIVVGGAASGSCTLEGFLSDETPLFY